MATKEDIIRFIEDNRNDADIGKPATDAEIKEAEDALGVRFPNSY